MVLRQKADRLPDVKATDGFANEEADQEN